MKKLKLIYNPMSGDKSFKNNLDKCVDIFQKNNYEVHLFRCMDGYSIDDHVKSMDEDYDIIVASGGDGTVNLVLNAIMKRGLDIPIGIIPSGTANDFATFLGFKSRKIEECCRIIMETKPTPCDLGLVNKEAYFINVCAGGLLTNISQMVDKDLKNTFGLFSYYLKGMEQVTTLKKAPFRITTSDSVYEEELYLYMILNSSGTGGFLKLAPEASISDGRLDLIGIKKGNLIDVPTTFIKVLRGEHTKDHNILCLTDTYFKVECLQEDFPIPETTIDGELGCCMPLEVEVVPQAIKVFVAKHEKI